MASLPEDERQQRQQVRQRLTQSAASLGQLGQGLEDPCGQGIEIPRLAVVGQAEPGDHGAPRGHDQHRLSLKARRPVRVGGYVGQSSPRRVVGRSRVGTAVDTWSNLVPPGLSCQ